MTIGIEFERQQLDGKQFIRIAPFIHGIRPNVALNIKATMLFVLLMGTVVAIGKVFEQ